MIPSRRELETKRKHGTMLCPYCEKVFSQFVRHLLLKHADMAPVQKLNLCPKRSRERHMILKVLQNIHKDKFSLSERNHILQRRFAEQVNNIQGKRKQEKRKKRGLIDFSIALFLLITIFYFKILIFFIKLSKMLKGSCP